MLAKEVRRLAFPAIAHSLLQTLVMVVDRAMLGHHAPASLASMQIGGALEWSLWSVFSAFEVGTIARVGFHVGAGRPERARRAAWMSIALALAFGTAVAAVSPVLIGGLGWAVRGASPAVLDAAGAYLEWTLGASPVVFVAIAAIATLQAGGDTRTPLAIGIAANIVHVGMNRVLILGAFGVPALGARGAGISTSITFTLEAALALFALSLSGRAVSLRARPGATKSSRAAYLAEARLLSRVAVPAVVERVLYHLGFLGFVAVIARLGDAAMAANQSLISIEAICFMSADGFGVAAAALVAQKLGAGRPDDAEKAARLSIRYAVVLLTAAGLVFLVLRRVVLPIFSSDPLVIAIGAAAVPVLALAQPFMATATVLAQSLRGAGETRLVLGVSAFGALFLRLVCTWLFAITLDLGLTGVWIGSTCDWIARALLLLLLGRRRARAVIDKARRASRA